MLGLKMLTLLNHPIGSCQTLLLRRTNAIHGHCLLPAKRDSLPYRLFYAECTLTIWTQVPPNFIESWELCRLTSSQMKCNMYCE